MKNNNGPKTDPWETPLLTCSQLDILPLTATLCLGSLTQFPIQLAPLPDNQHTLTSANNLLRTYHSQQPSQWYLIKSFLKVKINNIHCTLLIHPVRNCFISNKLIKYDLPFVNPWWLSWISLYLIKWSLIWSLIHVSNIFSQVKLNQQVHHSQIPLWILY